MSPFLLLALIALVSLIALGMLTRMPAVQQLDDRLEEWVITHRARVHHIASIATLPGERLVHPTIAALTAATLLLARGGPPTRMLIPLASASLGGIITHHVVKFFYHRHRPAGALARAKTEAAFPSGHTTNATAVLATSAYMLVREGVVPLPVAIAVAVVIIALTGASRVALGWHWGTDVIGGWFGGIGVAALSCLIFEQFVR
ncbi:MAG: phosphatase PAP2 family protein [bacterium]